MGEQEDKIKAEKEAKAKTEAEAKAKDNSGTGDETKTITTLDRADQIAQMQKRENDRREELLTREEQLQARKAVGGVTEAGQNKEKNPKSDAELASEARVQKIGEAAGAQWAEKKKE